MDQTEQGCRMCPRQCGVNRAAGARGFCGMPEEIYLARVAPHEWEEPPISGQNGSGTVFFSGCHLRCIFCQNRDISRGRLGEAVSDEQMISLMLNLQEQGVHNINLVTPSHYTRRLAGILERVRPHLRIPVIWNCGGYESCAALTMLDGLVDIYLPDFKYMDPALSAAYSGVSDYAEVAGDALLEMYRQVGTVRWGEGDRVGLMDRGIIVRHLVLPGCRKDSLAVLHRLTDLLPIRDIRLSLMRQYTPDFAMDTPYPNLHRRLTDFEYQSVVQEADRLGFEGYIQGKGSASARYTPNFQGGIS